LNNTCSALAPYQLLAGLLQLCRPQHLLLDQTMNDGLLQLLQVEAPAVHLPSC
jgi:hypothetical protein